MEPARAVCRVPPNRTCRIMIERSEKVRFFPGNPHLQTVLRSWKGEQAKYAEKRVLVPARDGEPLDVDLRVRTDGTDVSSFSADTLRGGSWAVLLHGLEGSTHRPYMVALSNGLTERGFRVAALNFRGCGGRPHRSPHSYHAGRIEDLEDVVRWLGSNTRPDHLHLAGFSLGGSVVMHMLARSEHASTIRSGAAVSPPFDLAATADRLETGMGRLYTRYFLRSLRKKAARMPAVPGGPGRFDGTTLRDFDEQVTAPVHGFRSAADYYERCSPGRWLGAISRPLLVVHAQDDPICPLPGTLIDPLERHGSIRAVLTRGGGHVAFLEPTQGWLSGLVAGHFVESPPAGKR